MRKSGAQSLVYVFVKGIFLIWEPKHTRLMNGSNLSIIDENFLYMTLLFYFFCQIGDLDIDLPI